MTHVPVFAQRKGAVALLCAFLLCWKINNSITHETVSLQNHPAFYEIALNMGYTDIETEAYEVTEVKIPENFGKVYQRYNELLKNGGYDLSPYKGKKCTRYTYLIPPLNARANILVLGGKIIGGDISGITIDSIMIPLEKEYETKKKIKP